MSNRYQRHGLIEWFDQGKMQEARVIVVGAGAVGNEVLKNLALLGVGHIHIIDFDRIEEHNLTRCVLFRDSDIGRFKAEVAAASCQQIDPHIEVSTSCSDFWDSLALGEIAEADAVVCCVDNFEARINLNKLCLMTSTDFFNIGIDSRYASVEMFTFSTNPECACYRCSLPPSVYSAIGKRYSCGWLRKVALEENKIPTTVITSSMAGSAVVSLVLNRLNEHPQAIQGAIRLFMDTISLHTTLSVIQRNDDCFACGSIDPHALRIRAKRVRDSKTMIPLIGEAIGEIRLSEPVLIHGECKLCGYKKDYYESSRKLDDSVTFCASCDVQSVWPEFVDSLSVEDFIRVFAGRNLPCKYLVYNANNRQIVIEMED